MGRALPFLEHSPGNGGTIPQETLDLLTAPLLMLRVCSQSIEDPGDATGCGVMALEHERVHFGTEVLARQDAPILLLEKTGNNSVSVPSYVVLAPPTHSLWQRGGCPGNPSASFS